MKVLYTYEKIYYYSHPLLNVPQMEKKVFLRRLDIIYVPIFVLKMDLCFVLKLQCLRIRFDLYFYLFYLCMHLYKNPLINISQLQYASLHSISYAQFSFILIVII